jgi:hypothetical protein
LFWFIQYGLAKVNYMVPDYTKEFAQLVDLQKKVNNVHPALAGLYPMAIAYEGLFYIFDLDQKHKVYTFRKTLPLPMPIPQGIRAAFPLEDYEGKIACVVTPDVFEKPEGYVTILHEFVHCFQYETCEQELKMSLDVARQAQEVGNVMWEIEHPFPYQARDFIHGYQKFLSGINQISPNRVYQARQELREYLGLHDFEYMVWQEWKEGFARWVENQVKNKLGMAQNKKGLEQPYSRVLFYAGGAAYITYLGRDDKTVAEDVNELFHKMLE